MFAGSLKESHNFVRWFLSLLYEHARSHPRFAGDERVSLYVFTPHISHMKTLEICYIYIYIYIYMLRYTKIKALVKGAMYRGVFYLKPESFYFCCCLPHELPHGFPFLERFNQLRASVVSHSILFSCSFCCRVSH